MYVAQEHSIYGSSRVCVDNRKDTLYMGAAYTPTWGGVGTSRRDLGSKSFELANHLGNVLVTLSDKPIYKVSSGTVYFNPEVTSISDYYPFGAPIAGRGYSSEAYRFGFNTQEKTDEIAGPGNHNTATFWECDSRLGRRWNLDPKPQIGTSDYVIFRNNPIGFTDVLGDSVWLYATTLPGSSGLFRFGTHTFIVVKTSDDLLHYYVYGPADDRNVLGESPLVRKSRGVGLNGGYTQDKNVINGTDNGDNLNNKFLIDIPLGMSQNDFDKKVISVAESFGNNPGIMYDAFSNDPATGNCNTSTTTILLNSGVTKEKIASIKSQTKGLNWGFGDKKPWTKGEQYNAVQIKNSHDEILRDQKKLDPPGKY